MPPETFALCFSGVDASRLINTTSPLLIGGSGNTGFLEPACLLSVVCDKSDGLKLLMESKDKFQISISYKGALIKSMSRSNKSFT